MKVLGGDFGEGKIGIVKTIGTDKFRDLVITSGPFSQKVIIRREDLERIEELNTSSGADGGGALGGAAIGAVLAGPLGMLAGAVLGGSGSKILLMVHLTFGRKFLCEASRQEYGLLLSATMFSDTSQSPREPPQIK